MEAQLTFIQHSLRARCYVRSLDREVKAGHGPWELTWGWRERETRKRIIKCAAGLEWR